MNRHRRRAGLLVAALLLLGACASPQGNGPQPGSEPFETFAGETTSLRQMADRPMVVNFFASWCPPCVAEMPDFERAHVARSDDVRFLGINTQDSRSAALELIERTAVTYDLAWDPDGALFRAFEVVAMPSTFFVDADGVVVHRHAGLLTEDDLHDLIDKHLAS